MDELKYGFAWDDSFKLGYEQVDEQHRQVFSLVDNLVSSCIDGNNSEQFQETLKTLNFLVEYVVKHFNDEEALQIQCGYPDYQRHKKIHDDFKITVSKLVEKFIHNASLTELSDDINRIIVRWLVNHICREDKKIGDYIRSTSTDTTDNK